MQNLSDIIEQFILDNIGEEDSLNLSRNELANFFNVSPSQINYVLSTRFTTDRGYLTESKRGGGGYIVVKKISFTNNYLNDIINNLNTNLDYSKACFILENLYNNDLISLNELNLIKVAINPKSLSTPFKIENNIRYNILKNILINLQNRGN